MKTEIKEEDCQNPPPAKKTRHSPAEPHPLTGGPRTPQSNGGSGHYSPYQTQPSSNSGMLAHTSPENTPGGPRSQEHVAGSATTPSGGKKIERCFFPLVSGSCTQFCQTQSAFFFFVRLYMSQGTKPHQVPPQARSPPRRPGPQARPSPPSRRRVRRRVRARRHSRRARRSGRLGPTSTTNRYPTNLTLTRPF